MMKKINFMLLMFALIGFMFFVSADSYSEGNVCCERNLTGAYCISEDSLDSCNSSLLGSYTSCDSTSYCKLGTCYDSNEGICMARTPKAICESQGFVWDSRDETQIPQCQMGCCLISNEVAFTTLTRCRTISQDYGVPINYRSDIDTELECVALAIGQDEGACVYELDYGELTCERTTRDECDALGSINYAGDEESRNPLVDFERTFYKEVLCSTEKLGTVCTPQANTGCYDSQVYWYDSCGNRENVVFVANNNEGLRDEESANSGVMSGYSLIRQPEDSWYGACDVFESTICDSMDSPDKFVQHECRDTSCVEGDGTVRINGESWCVYDGDEITFNTSGAQSVGSRPYRQMCLDGRIVTEACDAYRSKVCYEDEITFESAISVGGKTKNSFSSAACLVNRWQDCITQDNKNDCNNFYQRDCVWVESPPTGISLVTGENGGVCLAKYSPGTKFWETSGEEQCSLGSATCVVEYDASLWNDFWHMINKERRDEIFEEAALGNGAVTNVECVDGTWEQDMNLICASLGDCGGNVNYISVPGSGGYQIKEYEFYRTGDEAPTNFSIRQTDYRTVMEKINEGLTSLNNG